MLVLFIYLLAFSVAMLVYSFFVQKGLSVFMATLWADVAATIVVWIAGIIFNNSSVYDPYWSIAPPVIIVSWLYIRGGELNAADVLLLIAVMVWGVRLTYNWVKRFKGFTDQDWRYIMLHDKAPKLWFLTNFGGINMMPTLFVYLGMMPAYSIIFTKGSVGFLSYIGLAIALVCVLLQLMSDNHMEKYRAMERKGCIDVGLWRYSRHPNYLGEVFFWWSLLIIQMGYNGTVWPNIIGAVFMTGLFVFVSIPMMEKYLIDKYPDYAEYKRKVPMLLPIKFK